MNVANGLAFNTNYGAITTFNLGGLSGNGNIKLSDGINAVTLNVGGNAANTTYSGGLAGSGGLTKSGLGNLVFCGLNSRSAGTVDFTLPMGTQSATHGITTNTPNTPAGILGSYATVGGTNWATSMGTSGNIVAYTAYTTGDLGALSVGSGLNFSPSGPQSPVAGPTSINTRNLTGSEGVTMTGTGSLTLLGGGLIGNTSGAVNGGTLTGPAAGELIVLTPLNLTIGSTIADNAAATALTKAGSATLTLTAANTYTGATTINQGRLTIDGSLAGAVTVNSGGTLAGAGSLASVNVNAGGCLSPGDAPGTIALNGTLALQTHGREIGRGKAERRGYAETRRWREPGK